mgnify:CR=1 FL=1
MKKKFFRWVLIPLCLVILLLPSCYPALSVSLDTNIGFFNQTSVAIINTTPYYFEILANGRYLATVKPYDRVSASLWSGNYYGGSEVAISVVSKNFAHTEKIWVCSSAYGGRYSHVLTIREDKYGGLWVERN